MPDESATSESIFDLLKKQVILELAKQIRDEANLELDTERRFNLITAASVILERLEKSGI